MYPLASFFVKFFKFFCQKTPKRAHYNEINTGIILQSGGLLNETLDLLALSLYNKKQQTFA